MTSEVRWVSCTIHEQTIKDLIVSHFNAMGVLRDNEDVDIDFGHWFEPVTNPGEEPWNGHIPVTFRIETRKEVPVIVHEA